MKGVVFVELLKMAEESFGEEAVDEVLDACDLASGGAYTTVGTYPCSELVEIVTQLSAKSGIPGAELQRKFGHWMMDMFAEHYPDFFKDKADSFDMLEAIDGEVHVEVRKLYPDAELPRFQTERTEDGALNMHYTSARPLVPFCQGLIEATLEEFKETGSVEMLRQDADNTGAIFAVRRTG